MVFISCNENGYKLVMVKVPVWNSQSQHTSEGRKGTEAEAIQPVLMWCDALFSENKSVSHPEYY
jgi:hypothetical protein